MNAVARIANLLLTQFSRFIRWWFSELRWLVPGFLQPNKVRLEVHAHSEGFGLRLTRFGQVLSECRVPEGSGVPPEFASATLGRQPAPVWFFPEADSVLSRVVQIPTAASNAFERILDIEINRWSPFHRNEVFAAWQHTSQGEMSQVTLFLVSKALVASWKERLAGSGLALSVLVLGPGHELSMGTRTESLLGHFKKRAFLLTILTLGVLLASCDWLVAQHKLDVWKGRYKSELAALSKQSEIEADIDAAIKEINAKNSLVPVGVALSSLAGALPNTDWVTEISVKNQDIVVRGFTLNLEELVRRVERIAADNATSLQGEVTFDPGTDRQRFSIGFRPRRS